MSASPLGSSSESSGKPFPLPPPLWSRLFHVDSVLSGAAVGLMLFLPLLEITMRPLFGQGIDNAPTLVQHLGLVLAMFGALRAERGQHLTSVGPGLSASTTPWVAEAARWLGRGGSAFVCGMLVEASIAFVASEMEAPRTIAYGIAGWMFEVCMPLGFAILGFKLAWRLPEISLLKMAAGLLLPMAGYAFASQFDGASLPLLPFAAGLVLLLLCGAPIFAILGGLALALFWSEGQPLASVPISHYQITVNPSLPALPLFTLAGLVFARTAAAARLGKLFSALFGHGAIGTALAAAVVCSFFTAFTGGSGVTILALGGLLLPLLKQAGFPEKKGIGLVTSASALGVLLAPSVPLIMFAIIARVPINTMFLAGLLPAMVMVASLLLMGGYLRTGGSAGAPVAVFGTAAVAEIRRWQALRDAKWELAAPLVAIGSLISGLATPTESAALTAAYAFVTQSLIHRELGWKAIGQILADCAEVIGGIMLILGMALGLTNFLVDAGIPDLAIEWVQSVLPDKLSFLLALNIFLLVAGALMEIYAAIVVLVPLLLPVALSYGIDPVHFGVIFLANIEMGFLCPPAGMNVYFASAMFGKSVKEVGLAVLPAVLAMLCGAIVISAFPALALWLPRALGN